MHCETAIYTIDQKNSECHKLWCFLCVLVFASYIFWMGDLNCRLDDTSRESVLKAIESNNMKHLLKLDQVNKVNFHNK